MADEKKLFNKIIFGGETLIDLTGDTVEEGKLLSGITAHDKTGEIITGTCTYDSDTSDATASIGDILSGQTAYVRGAKVTGTMTNVGAQNSSITTVDQEIVISNGYHDGSGKVKIADAEQEKLIASNIRQGITILGVEGTMSGQEDVHAQSKTVTPTKDGFTVTPDDDYNYLSEVTVNAIPYVETPNAAGGITVTIG